MMMDRRFSREEAQRIFAAAAERQQRTARDSETDDLTVSELEDAALAAGIDPSFVRAAAMELARPDHTDVRKRVLGLDVERRQSIFLPGRIQESDWPTVVHALRDLFHERGVSSELGHIYEWSSHSDKSKLPFHITAEALDDGTRVTIERNTASQHLGLAAAAIPFVLVTLALMVVSFFGPPDLWRSGILLLPIAMFMLIMAYSSSHFGRKKESRRFDEVIDVVRHVLPASSDDVTSPTAHESGTTRLADPAIPEESGADDVPPLRVRRTIR